ncbi:MAG: YaaA family protein [Cetobacterium sp.]
MKILFSPSKSMKYKNIKTDKIDNSKNHNFNSSNEVLLDVLKALSKDELGKKLKIKGNILDETFNIYQNFEDSEEREAITLYDGVSFKQIKLSDYSCDDFSYVRDNLYIFSALYGLLNADSFMRPYRLDMTNKILDISLYSFWKEKIYSYLIQFKHETFINIASKEFSKILNRDIFNIIDIEFRQTDGVKLKNISTEAKKARGAMLHYLIKNKINSLDKIKEFTISNYAFSTELSNEKVFFFIKDSFSIKSDVILADI